MKIVVFGSTGKTGKELVKLLAKRDHTITAFARNPDKVDTYDGKVIIVQGDARDDRAVARAIKGQDVVMATFGPRSLKHDDLQEVFATNLVSAMNKYGIKRLIELSAWGAGDSAIRTKLPFKIIRKTLLKNVFDDKNKGEDLIIGSDLSYTFVRPGHLKGMPSRGKLRASQDGKGIHQTVSREDVAAFMIDQLTDTSWLRKSPIVGY